MFCGPSDSLSGEALGTQASCAPTAQEGSTSTPIGRRVLPAYGGDTTPAPRPNTPGAENVSRVTTQRAGNAGTKAECCVRIET